MDEFQPIFAVILVLSLLGGLLFFLRRRGIASFSAFPAGTRLGRAAANARQLKVVERVPLGAQHALHLVRVGDKLMLVATAPGSCQILDAAVREGTGL